MMNTSAANNQSVKASVEEAEVMSFTHPEDPVECPVQPLGHSNGHYYFTDVAGEFRDLAMRDFTDKSILSLFGGDSSWPAFHYPATNKKGEPIPGEFHVRKVTAYLMRKCHARGLYDANAPLRGLGVWRWKDSAVVNAGSAIWHSGKWHAPGLQLGGATYIARPRIEKPEMEQDLDPEKIEELRRSFNMWSYSEEGDADLLFGWMGASLLGGYPRWRAHVLIIGERGTGKTSLGEHCSSCLGDQGVSLNDYTEGGLRQTLQNEARTTWLDEAETGSDVQSSRMAAVIRLLRNLSGEKGARITRGSANQQAMNSTVTGCMLLTAIHSPPLEPQDRSRIITMNLNKPTQGESSSQDLLHYKAMAQAMSPALRGHAVRHAKHFSEAFELYHKILLTHGCDGRQADLYATSLAGRSILLDKEVPTIDEAHAFVKKYEARLKVIFMEDSDASDGQSCLNHLLDYMMDVWRDGKKVTIGQFLCEQVNATDLDDRQLATYGMRLIRQRPDPHAGERITYHTLFVPNGHAQLRRIFTNTVWSGGGWKNSLRRLPYVEIAPPVSVAGQKRRGLYIPSTLLPDMGASDYPPYPPRPP
jgi:hypothetical protein